MERLLQHQFVRFCLVGGLGFLINLALLTLFYKMLGWPSFIAQLLAGEVALFSNFMLHHTWTYKGHGVKKSIIHLLIQFHATSWIAIVGTALIVSSCIKFLHMPYVIALVISSAIALVWNYVWTKYVIWRKHEHQGSGVYEHRWRRNHRRYRAYIDRGCGRHHGGCIRWRADDQHQCDQHLRFVGK